MAVTERGNAMLPSSVEFLGFNWDVFRTMNNQCHFGGME
jgi:hypothetical protein